jgi:uncharacterized protein (DUF4415 family)
MMNDDFQQSWETTVTLSAADAQRAAAPRARSARQADKALKQIVTIRLDVDMLEWFKQQGPGYQTRINQLLREHMDASKSKSQPQ